METRTQPVDKILEALAVLQEARRQQEEEFVKRLEEALQEAENLAAAEKEKVVAAARAEVSAEMQARQDEVVAEACEKVATDMRNQFQETLRETTDQLGADFARQSQEAAEQWAAEKSSLQDQANLWRTYAEAQQQLAESSSQAEMLTRFLNIVEPFAGAVAVYVAKADGLALWRSRGQGAFSDLVSKDTIDPESFFRPLVVRDRTVAAVCAAQPYKEEPLDFLSSCLGRAIEAFGMKLKMAVTRPTMPAVSAPAPDEKLAAEARRTARLLVSEIKLYNEKSVSEGRTTYDLYARLRWQIDQGRDQYRQRMNGAALTHDYYHEELVRVLADGEARRLGSDYPGPMTA